MPEVECLTLSVLNRVLQVRCLKLTAPTEVPEVECLQLRISMWMRSLYFLGLGTKFFAIFYGFVASSYRKITHVFPREFRWTNAASAFSCITENQSRLYIQLGVAIPGQRCLKNVPFLFSASVCGDLTIVRPSQHNHRVVWILHWYIFLQFMLLALVVCFVFAWLVNHYYPNFLEYCWRLLACKFAH